MRNPAKRILDVGAALLLLALVAALVSLEHRLGGTALLLTVSLIAWLMISVLLGALIGHCALGEERNAPNGKRRWSG